MKTCAPPLKDWKPIRKKDSKSDLPEDQSQPALRNCVDAEKPETLPLHDQGLPTAETSAAIADEGRLRVVSSETVPGFEDSILGKAVESRGDSPIDSAGHSFQRDLEDIFNGDEVYGGSTDVACLHQTACAEERWAKLYLC